MTFKDALRELLKGKRIKREDWGGATYLILTDYSIEHIVNGEKQNPDFKTLFAVNKNWEYYTDEPKFVVGDVVAFRIDIEHASDILVGIIQEYMGFYDGSHWYDIQYNLAAGCMRVSEDYIVRKIK